MDEIDEAYYTILEADEFIKEFDTLECFREWCNTGDVVDLEEVRRIFEAYELYEHCAIIKEVLDAKK